MTNLPPALVMLLGAALTPYLKGPWKRSWMMLLPLWSLYLVHTWPEGASAGFRFLDYHLVLCQMDRLNRVFGYIFCIISVLAVLFALKVDDDLQHTSALVYAGGALGVTLSGDFFSLYFFWEVMAVASTFVILAGRTAAARRAAFRYVLVHLFGGLLLLGGILMRYQATGDISVTKIGLTGPASWLIFAGIAVNAAIPPLHPWLKDAYPKATATGAVFLSAFTTKSAVYLMARTFPGTELLIWLGAIMTFVPIFYAVLENDIRSVLSYSLINQVGFMMCGIGIGSALAINGAVSHAFAHILYKGLLFMAAGSVLTQTGKIRCTDLGGLYKYMPLTCVCCMVGAASISAFPLFSGFVSKSMIVSAAGHEKLIPIWLMLQFASAGVFHHAGIKVPFFMFFGHDSGLKPKEPAWNMKAAMILAALFCVGIGVYPQPLYDILPFPVDYAPYTGAHVVGQLQLLMFGALAFALLMLAGVYPPELRAINLDTDWFYRKGGRVFARACDIALNTINAVSEKIFVGWLAGGLGRFCREAPARLSLYFLETWWALCGLKPREISARAIRARDAFRTGTLPVGAGAATAILALLAVYLFS